MSGRKGQSDIDAGRKAIADREKTIADHNKAVDGLLEKLDAASRDETAQSNRTGDEARRQEREENADPLWNTFIPAGAGAVGGAGIGEVENRILHSFSKGSANALIEASDELGPVEKLTNSQLSRARASGMAQAAEKYTPSSVARQGAALTGRLAGYGIPAGVFYNEHAKYENRANDQSATETDRLANQRISNALLGVSTGIAADGGMRFFFPTRVPGEGKALSRGYAARDFVSRMDSADAARKAPRPTPAQPASTNASAPATPRPMLPGSKADLKAQAKRYNIPGRSAMTVDELRVAVGEAVQNTTAPRGGAASKALKGLAGPVVAGAVAADAAYNQARASGEGVGGSLAAAAPQAAVTGGGVGAGLYGVNKLLERVPAAVGKAVGMAGEAMAPSLIDSMTDPTAEEMDTARHWFGRNLPSWARTEAQEDAYQQSLVPERNPLRTQAPQQSPEQELPSAAALEIPSDMGAEPAPQEEPDFESQLAELQTMLQQIGQAQEPGPVANAANSQAASRAQFSPSPSPWQASTIPTNRLLAGAY